MHGKPLRKDKIFTYRHLHLKQAELLYKEFQVKKEKLKSQTKEDIVHEYGNAASEDKPPMELLMGQTEMLVEYDRAGRVIKGQVS